MKTFRSQLNGWLFILSRYQMKNTKSAGLVSCDFEARLINKLNRELSSAKQHKKHKAKEFKNKHGTYYKRTT